MHKIYHPDINKSNQNTEDQEIIDLSQQPASSKRKNEDPVENLSTQRTKSAKITNFFTIKESRDFFMAKIAAVDGMSINAMKSSEMVREYITKKGFVMPTSNATIWNDIKKFYNSKITELKKIISVKKSKGQKFSILEDEWTDVGMTRYLNLILHDGTNSQQCGLIPIPKGSCTADVVANLVKEKLQNLDLDLDDIVGSTHDSASLMKLYSTKMPFFAQDCLNHGIHLGVLDTFYNKEEKHQNEDSDSENENVSDCQEKQCSIFNTVDGNLQFDIEDDEIPLTREDISNVLNYVRKIVKKFKKSSLKYSSLRENIQRAHQKKLSLILDVKTRWVSILPMLKRFDEVKKEIQETLQEFNDDQYDASYEEIIKSLIKSLEPVEEAVKKLSAKNVDLMTADAICNVMLSKIEKLDSEISQRLLQNLKKRIDERRNSELISILRFLHTAEYPTDTKYFKYSSKSTIRRQIKEVYNKIHSNPINPPSDENSSDENDHNEIENF